MLVLHRKQGERIKIGDDIIITIIGWKGAKIRVGVDAPDSLRVNRIPPLSEEKNASKTNGIS